MSRAAESPLTALGLMSGTSMDGIDIALLHTDGEQHIHAGADGFTAYSAADRAVLRAALDIAARLPTPVLADMALWPDELIAADACVTDLHISAVTDFLHQHGLQNSAVDLIGLHGQTVIHRPDEGFTLQIGDAQALAGAVNIDVVAQFRHADMAAGGQGAPLAPLFHNALVQNALVGAERPQAVLNLGGIANLSWFGADDALLAFDTGPANALIDDWMAAHGGAAFDKDGALAAQGAVDETALSALLDNAYFAQRPPKSLDRLAFDRQPVVALSAGDGAATLTAFTAHSIALGLAQCPAMPTQLILCGGGRHNKTLCAMLAQLVPCTLVDCDALGWHGDALEAQLFAWLAVRSRYGLPLSRPETTGVKTPISGGVLFRP